MLLEDPKGSSLVRASEHRVDHCGLDSMQNEKPIRIGQTGDEGYNDTEACAARVHLGGRLGFSPRRGSMR